MKTQVIGFDAAARDGLDAGNPHIVYDAIPRIGRILGSCSGCIEVAASRAEKVMALMAAAGFKPQLLPGKILSSNHGDWHDPTARAVRTYSRAK